MASKNKHFFDSERNKLVFDFVSSHDLSITDEIPGIKDRNTLIESASKFSSLESIENHKKGEKVTVEELTEEMVKMRKDFNEMKPALGSMSKLSIDAVKASTAAEDYLWDSKKLLAYHQVDYIWKKYSVVCRIEFV